jgi:hypothetical protein
MSLRFTLSSVLAVVVLSSLTLPVSYAAKGAGSGGGTPDVTQPGITVAFQDPCSSGVCPAFDPLARSRDLFNRALPFNPVVSLPSQKTAYANVWEFPKGIPRPGWSTTYFDDFKAIAFDTTGPVPLMSLTTAASTKRSVQKCAAQMTTEICTDSGYSPVGLQEWVFDYGSQIVSDGSEYRANEGGMRYTLRTIAGYILIKLEVCDHGNWIEAGYYLFNTSRDRIKDYS